MKTKILATLMCFGMFSIRFGCSKSQYSSSDSSMAEDQEYTATEDDKIRSVSQEPLPMTDEPPPRLTESAEGVGMLQDLDTLRKADGQKAMGGEIPIPYPPEPKPGK